MFFIRLVGGYKFYQQQKTLRTLFYAGLDVGMLGVHFAKLKQRWHDLTARAFRANGWPVALFCSVFFFGLIYRLNLVVRLYREEPEAVAGVSPAFLLGLLLNELLFALAVLAVAALLHGIFRHRPLRAISNFLRWPAYLLVSGLVFLIGAIYTFHLNLLFTYRTGLTFDMIQSTVAAGATRAMVDEGSFSDTLFACIPLALFWLNCFLPQKLAFYRNAGTVACAAGVLLLAPLAPAPPQAKATDSVLMSPVTYTLQDTWKALRTAEQPAAMPTTGKQEHSVALVDPIFSAPKAAAKVVPQSQAWDLVFVILESTGADYVFDTSYGNAMPMPELHRLAAQSLHAENHFTGTNTTPRSVFSIFSGLYADPRVEFFITRKDIRIPSIKQWLPKTYRGVYVYNGAASWFFPEGFIRNSGFTLYTTENFPQPKWPNSPNNGLHDVQLFDFFLEEMKKCKSPCISVYHSFAAHWPYWNYGQHYDVFQATKSRVHPWIRRYYANLRLLDTLIEKLVRELTKSGRLKHTIVVITGDHGEAFGKHPDNWIHSRASYLENYHVPLVIYQPQLLPPRRIARRTQHPDIVPTLLEIMGVPYDTTQIQGESMLLPTHARHYDFFYGNEQTISSISRDNIFMQIALRHNQCWVFDLNRDPDQWQRLSCDGHNQQRQALLAFRTYQNRMLELYNSKLQTVRISELR